MQELPSISGSQLTITSSGASTFMGNGSHTINQNYQGMGGTGQLMDINRCSGLPALPYATYLIDPSPPSSQVPMSKTIALPATTIASKLRVVRVFLVDPDERVPAAKRILYRSAEMETEATDQELFYDIDIKQILAKHNDYRAGVEWEEGTSDGTKTHTGLKPVRIRDLKMVVTTIAEF